LGRSYGTPNDIDEDDLEAELACLGDEFESIDVEEDTSVTSAPVTDSNVSLPQPPTATIKQTTGNAKVDEYGLPIMY
jgi:hypothetical protein